MELPRHHIHLPLFSYRSQLALCTNQKFFSLHGFNMHIRVAKMSNPSVGRQVDPAQTRRIDAVPYQRCRITLSLFTCPNAASRLCLLGSLYRHKPHPTHWTPIRAESLTHYGTIWYSIWSCLIMIFSCTWVAVLPNILCPKKWQNSCIEWNPLLSGRRCSANDSFTEHRLFSTVHLCVARTRVRAGTR